MSTTQITTADELWRMRPDGMRHELVRGELRTMSPGTGKHGYITIRIASPLDQFLRTHRLGAVLGAETGFKIATDPDTVRAPDVAFVSHHRIPAGGPPETFWPGAPDLAVEVVSPGDRASEVAEKVADWLVAGTRAVWVVRPRPRTVTVPTAPDSVIVLGVDDEIDGGGVVPGFRCRVGELFPD